MNRQRLLLSGVILLLLIGCIALVNHLLVRPALIGTLPEIKEARSQSAAKHKGPTDLYASTMEEIRSTDQDTPPAQANSAVRNPFLWPGQKAKERHVKVEKKPKPVMDSKPRPKPKKTDKDKLTLSMVLSGGAQSLALINNRFVACGSRIEGFTIKQIMPKSVIVANRTGTHKLTLSSKSFLQKTSGTDTKTPALTPEESEQKKTDPFEQILKNYLNPMPKQTNN